VRAAPVFLRLNRLSMTNRMTLMAAPNNLRSMIPVNLRGRMSVSYSKIHKTALSIASHRPDSPRSCAYCARSAEELCEGITTEKRRPTTSTDHGLLY
jgi:hypothetical protein